MKETCDHVEEKRCCSTCAHYCQHYILNKENHFVAIWYGHCTHRQVKGKWPDTVCPYWTLTAPSNKPVSGKEHGVEIRSYPIKRKWE